MFNLEKLLEYLPSGYEAACYEMKAISRERNIKSAEDLMRLHLAYLSQQSSLLEISVLSRLRGAPLSDVAYMKRFGKSGAWFEWINARLKPGALNEYEKPACLSGYRIIGVDATRVSSKGAVKKIYTLHYALDIFNMTGVEHRLTGAETGESLLNFSIKPDYLLIGDRAYGSKKGVERCISGGGAFIFRLRNKAFKLYDENGAEICLLSFLNGVTGASEMTAYMESSDKKMLPLRLCASRKTEEQIAKSKEKLRKEESRRQLEFSPGTWKTHEYVILASNLPADISADVVLRAYRYRWQAELYFKRLKSIMDFGSIPKKTGEGMMTWLSGKLMLALLIETLLSAADFSPYDCCG
jgi:hypothetical protein